MKKWPLFIQITVVFSGILLCTALLLFIFLPLTLKNFFTEEIFTTIQNSQQFFYHKNSTIENGKIDSPSEIQSARTVNHVVVTNEGKIIKGTKLNQVLISKIIEKMDAKQLSTRKFSIPFKEETIFIVAQKINERGNNYYLISFMWDTYRNELVVTLFKRILFLMVIIFIISIFISSALAKRLTKPIILMKKHVKKLANRNWQEPLVITRKDELGELAHSIEEMRKQLLQQDKAQQSFMQNISHDLKTPVMVIQSYTQAIKDGIFVKGTLESTTEIISQEAKRLENKIEDLLYLTKLQYLETKNIKSEHFQLEQLLPSVIERIKEQKSNVEWDQSIKAITLFGNPEQFEVALENILNNSIRFANEKIIVSTFCEQDSGRITIWNDGPQIDNELLQNLFKPFTKGKQGNFGLGLVIAKKVIESHQGSITLRNERGGVMYDITIPLFKKNA